MQCSVAQAAEILGDKWTLLILRDTFYGLSSFSQFQKNLGLARNILSDRLEKLVEHGLLERRQTRPGVERYTYHLTEKGRALFPTIMALMQWGDEWIFGEQGEPVHIVDRTDGVPIDTVQVRARDGRPLQANEVTFVPGPSADPMLIRFYEKQLDGKTS
jgi:DNA-binding HxlR family transcriptional regulator